MKFLSIEEEQQLRQLFEDFVDSGLHGRFEEALGLIEEPYLGVGMGEQGIVKGKAQAELVLRGGYRPTESTCIAYTIQSLSISPIGSDVAMMVAQVDIVNTPPQGEALRSGLMQTIGARRQEGGWSIVFTHASPTVLTMESVEAYPIRFMDHTIALLKADMQAKTMLYAEVNLSKNTVIRLEGKAQDWPEKPEAHSLEEAVAYGLSGKADEPTRQEYHAFWNRLRLLGLFAEGVTTDQFDYCLIRAELVHWIRASVELVRQVYSGDVIAVISYSAIDEEKQTLAAFAHKAFHDALTGSLNREGFEMQAAQRLEAYEPKHHTALYMIDLDDFKQINDRLGHQTGDAVLHQVAGVLENSFQESGIVGRVGGDEFMVLLTGDYSTAYLEEKADELLNAVKLRMGGSKQIPVSVSIGVAYGRARATFEKLYRIADIALYSSKRAGKCRYHLINADTNNEQSFRGAAANLLSLQNLLDYTEGKEITQEKTPYEALIENIPGDVLVIEITEENVTLGHCNDWARQRLGVTEEELRQRQAEDPFAFVHPEDVALLVELVQSVREGRDSFSVIYRVRMRDGAYKHVCMAASTTERRRGSVIMYGINTQVDDAIYLKREVELAHNRLQALVESIPGGVVILTLGEEIKVRHCNNWITRFLGYEEDLVARIEAESIFTLLHPDDMPIVEEAQRQLRAGVEHITPVYRLRTKQGLYKHIRVDVTLAERSVGEDIYYGVITDVDEVTTIQKQMQQNSSQLEALLEGVPAGLAVLKISDTLTVTQYNNWFYGFTGYADDKALSAARGGIALATVWTEDLPLLREAFRRVREGRDRGFSLDFRVKTKAGEPKRMHIHASVIERTAESVTMYAIYTDPSVGA